MIDDAVVSLQVLDQPRSGWRTGFWRGVVLLLAALVTGIALALSPALIHPPAPRTTAPVHTLSADKLLPAPPLARSMPFLPLAAEPVLGSSAAFALDPNILWGQNTAPQTQIAASNSAEQSYVRLSGAASSNLSPGSLLDLPLLNLPDPETAPVPASLPGDPPLALEDPQAGIFSISGSFAAFDPSGGGSSCYQPGITQTLCFDAEAYTTDGEWPTILTLLFPTGWQVSNVTDVGPHQCDNGGSIDPDMEWITYTLSNEIIISQTFMLTSPVDHCSTTYCVDVTMVDVGPSARVSWYWFVGSPVGASPHYVCSSDGYTPFGAPACEESLLPSASIASCAAAGADLAVDKTGPATVTAGDLLTYTITVHNNGPLDALNVVLTDTLPYGILPLSPLTYTLGDIAAGDAITVEVVAQSDPNACYEGKVNNFVEVASDTPDLDPTNNNDEWGTIILSQASLTIAKLSSPDPATAGGLVDFTLTITNTGPGCASDVIVIDELGYTSNPPDLVMEDYSTLSTQGSGPLAGYWYSCSSGGACQRAEPMPSGTVDTITLTLRIPADSQPGAYINFADVIWDSGSDNTPTFWNVIAEADLSIAKGVIKDEICLGSYGFYELVVTNGGPSDAQNVVVSDTLPAELLFGGGSPECSEAAGVVTCNAGTLAAGASADFLIAFNITPTVIGGTIITNTASVSSATSDPSPLSNTSNPATFTAVQCSLPEADMAIIKTVDPINVVAGEELTFTLTITNNGPHAAEDVTVQDLFLQPLEIVSLAIDPLVWSCDGGLSCIRQEAMPSGASETITLVVRLPSDVIPGDYTNTAFVNAANPDPDTSDNWAEAPYAVTAQPVLSIAKTALAAEMIAGGDPVQYSILVTNDGPSDAYDVPVVDVPDAGLDLLSLTPGPAVPITCGTLTCTIPLLPAGQVAEIYALAQAPATTASGTYTNTACIGDEPSLVFSAGPGTGAPPPDLGPYTMTPFPPDSRALIDVWDVPGPTGSLLFDRAMGHRRIGSGWATWSHGYTGDVYYSLGSTSLVMTLPPGTGAFYFYVEPNSGTVTFQATAQDGTTSGPISIFWASDARYFGFYALGGSPLASITITAASDFAVGEFGIAQAMATGSSCAAAPIEVIAAADLAVDKTGPATVTAGDLLTYTITVHNNGPADALNVVLTDTLPYGVLPFSPLTYTLGTIAAGDAITVEVVAQSDPNACYQGKVNNYVEVSSDTPDLDPTNNNDEWGTVILSQADLLIAKEALAASVTAGEAISYTLAVTNAGPGCATAVEVLDLAPPGTQIVAITADNPSSDGEFCTLGGVCELGTLMPAGTGVSALSLANSTPGSADGSTFDRTVTVSPGDLPAGSTITDVDIAVEFEKIDGEVCAAGHQGGQAYNNEIVFYLTSPSGTRVVLVDNYLNWGGSALGDTYTDFATYGGHVTVAFDDAAATIVGASPNPEYPTSGHFQPVEALSTLNGESPFGTWTLTVGDAQAFDALCFSGFDLTMTAEDTAASAPATINLVLAVDPDYSEGTLVNEAQVSADQADPDETNNIASVTTPVTTSADLSIAKTVIKDEICLGSYGFYELVATNGGPSDAQNVVVSDTLPADLIFGGGSPECSEAAGVVTCNAGTLAAGASADFLIAFNIDPSVVDGTPITNTASVSSSTPDPGPLPNSDSAAFTAVQCFLPEADMSITKSMAPDPLNAGETIAVTLTVTNNGLHAAENVTVQDLFFFAEQVDAFNLPPGWFCDGGVTCIRSNPMPAGAVETLSFSIHIAPDRSPGLYDNQAYVTADNPDSDLADNLDAYSYQVNTDASLTIAKVGMPDPVIAGGTLLYQLTITNTGPSVAWDVVVTDTLPAGATFAQASPGCSEAAGVVTCQLGDLGVDAPQSVFIAVIVDDALPDGTLLTNQACVTGTSNTTDNTPICASDDTMVNQSPLNPTDLALSMTLLETDPVGPIYNGVPGADGYTVAGGYLETQIVVENTGAAPATDVVLFSQLPYRFTFVEAEFDYNYDPAGPFLCTQESCALGSIPAGEAVTITMSILVESNAPLSLQSWHYFHNHVLIQAANPDPNTLNNWDQVGVTVEPLVDMEISKITTLDSVVPGENVTYEISAFNYGPSDLSWSWSQWQFGNYDELHIWDRLPVEVDPATVLIEMGGYYTGYYCGVVSGFVSCMFDLPAYHAAVLRITGQVRPDVTESFTNTAYAEDYYGTFIISDTAVVTVTPQADLVLDKSAPANGNAGELLGYTLSVQNNGPSHARGVVITDTLPAGATFLYGDSSCVDTGGVVACTIGTLPDGASATRYFTVTLASDLESGISLENIAFVAADTPDPDLTNNTDDADTTILGRADLALDKTGPTTIVAGEPITYTLLVNNAGPSTAQAVILQDSLPSGVSFTSAEVSSSSGGSLLCASPICDLGDVAVGEVLTVTLVGAVDPSLLPGTILTNTASLTSSTLDDDPVDNTAQAETLVETAADLAIDKVDLSDPVEPTEGFLYQINIANPGPSDAQDVVVVDTLGDGLTFSAASPGCSGLAGSPTVTCTLSTLGAGEETFFLLAVRAGDVPSGTVLVNTATITSTTIDWLPENNSDIEYTTVKQLPGPSADLAITKTASPTTVTAGDLVTYTLTVTNAGPQEATGVQLLELIPLHTEMVSISADNPDFAYPFCTLSGICYLGTIQPFSTTVTVVAVLRVDPDCMEPSLTNTATVFADQADHHPENNLASAVVGVGPWFTADLALEKAATATVIPGGMITYTLTVWNLGPQTAANLVLTDTLPADVTLSWVDPACTQAGQAVICTAPSLDSGQTITFSLAATANPGLEAGTSVENLALVTSDAYDPNPANNIDTADTSIAGWTDLVLVSMTGPERVTPGGLVTYTIVVFNNGPDIARAVEVRDDFPPDFTQLAISVQRSGGLSIPCGGAVCLVGDMAVGETVTVTVVGQAGIAIPPSPWVTNQATVYSGTPEYDLDNNTASLPLWIGYRLYMPLIPTSRPNGP